jgi:F420-non-reducing hydrogenase large subunit
MKMGKKLILSPVSRIEGHVQINLDLDDGGNVAECRTQVVNLRGFERFCLGRPVEEMPRITTSICGVCPTSHHMASAKVNDVIFGGRTNVRGKKVERAHGGNTLCH